jgi:hypothetical protein
MVDYWYPFVDHPTVCPTGPGFELLMARAIEPTAIPLAHPISRCSA